MKPRMLHLPRSERQDGFTFHELLAAMSIVSVAVLGYSAGTVSVFRGSQITANYTVAVNLAQDKMAELKAAGAPANENRCPSGGDLGIDSLGRAGGIFDRCWQISDSPLGGQLKQIDVRVSWFDFERREVAFTKLVYRE